MQTAHKTGLRLALLAAAILAAAGEGRAQTTIFTSRADFSAALGSYMNTAFNEDFNTHVGVPGNSPTYAFAGNGFQFTVSATSPVVSNDPNEATVYRDGATIGPYFSHDNLVLTFGPGVYAVGGDFFPEDINGTVDPNQQVKLELSDGTIDMFTAGADASDASAFQGFLSQTPITSLTFDPTEPDAGMFSTLDNLTVAAPEPGQNAAFGLGTVGLLALIIRAKRRQHEG